MNQIEIRFKSSALMMNAQILVLLPETLGGEKLKVLWLLHGGAAMEIDHSTRVRLLYRPRRRVI